MKIHHVTCEWDYTLGVEEIGSYHYLTLSILRQPIITPHRDLDGIRVRSWAHVEIKRHSHWGAVDETSERSDWGEVEEVWLRGNMSIHGVAGDSKLRFITRHAANRQLIRVYNALRRYERELLQ